MSELDMMVEQAVRAFVTGYVSGTLGPIPVFVAQYPEAVRPELVDFIEEYLLMEGEAEPIVVPPEALEATAAAMERVLGELRSSVPALGALRKARGLLPSKLARAVNLPVDFLGLLERGEVRLVTIPAQKSALLVRRLAQALERTTDEIWQSLRTPVPPSPVRMSAEDRATLGSDIQRDFAEALRQSAELTPGMRAEWLDEME